MSVAHKGTNVLTANHKLFWFCNEYFFLLCVDQTESSIKNVYIFSLDGKILLVW